ncbi:MAG TPA: hypothetical protein EYQ41_01115 [Micavibrio sp.]|nr:hypothetical protein [Micavibrio sp.]
MQKQVMNSFGKKLLKVTAVAGFAVMLSYSAAVMAQDEAPAAEADSAKTLEHLSTERCSKFSDPEIILNRLKGGVYYSPALTEEALASQKQRLFRKNMPERQGNVGHPEMYHKTYVKLAKFPTTGCVYLERLQADVRVDHRVYIAGEYPKGSCLYNGFYELEAELMQLDQDVINKAFNQFEAYLKSVPEAIRAAGPVARGSGNIYDLEKEHQENIERIVDSFVMKLEKDLMLQRRDVDDPAFYDDIIAECEGME